MDEAAIHELLSGRRRDVGATLLRGALSVGSWGYASVMHLRNLAYDRRWLSIQQIAAPVISLGNITTGGTGKTPTAAWLANWLVAEGYRPGLLSRGYRSLEQDKTTTAEIPAGNDEKMVLDRLCPNVPHLQQRDRVASGRRLVQESGCNVLILDDGFQHRRLHRDLDAVLIDALQPWGFDHVLPRGLLREIKSGLRRADLIVITRADQCTAAERQAIKSELQRIRGTPDCVEIAFAPTRLVGLDGSVQPVTWAATQPGLAFCGIGNPDGFRRTLSAIGATAELKVFPDHHHYQAADLEALAERARAVSAEVVLSTLKDLVKIRPNSWMGPPLYAVEIGVHFLSGQELMTGLAKFVVDAPR
ncbi:MAG: tetraacyldisaccharide 4-kinase [Schlesneria sp.]|nr:tetraacyldisaccharide 4-kinase [Schlesneria sp.]